MTGYKELLSLIEGNPTGDAELDEIDAKLLCYIKQKKYVSHSREEKCFPGLLTHFKSNEGEYCWGTPLYTRSRDALKAVRDEHLPGWYISWVGIPPDMSDYYGCSMFKMADKTISVEIEDLPTEELAELHAVIQAIEWERNNDKST